MIKYNGLAAIRSQKDAVKMFYTPASEHNNGHGCKWIYPAGYIYGMIVAYKIFKSFSTR